MNCQYSPCFCTLMQWDWCEAIHQFKRNPGVKNESINSMSFFPVSHQQGSGSVGKSNAHDDHQLIKGWFTLASWSKQHLTFSFHPAPFPSLHHNLREPTLLSKKTDETKITQVQTIVSQTESCCCCCYKRYRIPFWDTGKPKTNLRKFKEK